MPFPERVRSIAITGGGGVLVLGTEGGRLILWEVGDVNCESRYCNWGIFLTFSFWL